MFVLSTKSDYGLLLLSLLAKKPKQRYSINQITQEYDLPYSFLSRIASELVNAKLLTSKEGIHGGYALAKDPKKILLTDIVKALDGSWAPTRCTGGKEKACKYETVCPAKDHWKHHLQHKIRSLLASYSLQDIIR